MAYQPLSRRRRASPMVSSPVTLGGVLWVIVSAMYLWPFTLVQADMGAKLTANRGRRLEEGEAAVQLTYDVRIADDLYRSVEDATENGTDSVILNLPPGTFLLNTTLKITVSATLQGAPLTEDGPGTTLSCGQGDHSLIEFSGGNFHMVGVRIQGCNKPGLHITSSVDANITIEDCSFQNLSRELAPERVDVLNPGSPAKISESSTFALAVHAGSFSGSLTVRNSQFLGNHFSVPAFDARRRLYGAPSSILAGDNGNWRFSQQQPVTGAVAASEQLYKGRRNTRLTRETPFRGLDGGTTAWSMAVVDSSAGASGGRRRLAGDSQQRQYSMPLLESAKEIHPDLQVGPWADDMEAVFTVVCRTGGNCAITLEDAIFDNNTGVATGALYVLCDGASSCDVDMSNTTITNNRVLWQESTKILNDAAGAAAPDGWDYGPITSGVDLLTRMAAWLTYTYPLLEFYKTNERYSYLGADNLGLLPKVVGRTLGAVVFHQRNSPWPGVLPSASRPMMRVSVTGGRLSGNEGAAIMSTAMDFMELAGGNGTWSGEPPRHSADLTLSDVDIADHTSGWPAIWVRWARKVEMRNCQVTRSTGAAWFDEVRDTALVEDSVFKGNDNTDAWIDYLYYILDKSRDDIGVEAAQLLKIQMTPLGDTKNTATIRGCQFEGNPSVTTGVVCFLASDYPLVDVGNQPGKTFVEVYNSTFANNFCHSLSSDGKCTTGERPLYMYGVYNAAIVRGRFLGNANGGAYFASVYEVSIEEGEFYGNNLTYSAIEALTDDNSFGGAGVFGESIGAGGIKVTSTNFTRNYAAVGGGAVYLRFFDFLQATNCRFEGNTAATHHGGAIWLQNSYGSTTTRINSCVFDSNTAGGSGGAISAYEISQSGFQIGWQINKCEFISNVALLNPSFRGGPVVDQAGGGAVFANNAALSSRWSSWTGNKVLAHAGGAIRLTDSTAFSIVNCTFEDNVAIMGGAVAVSRISGTCIVRFCAFTNNTVVEPSWQHSTSESAPSMSFIDPGYGGAFYAFYSSVLLGSFGEFIGNSAKFGGALAVVSSPVLNLVEEGYLTYDTNIQHVNVSGDVAESVGLTLLGGPALPYRYLFSNNTALIGGAVYVYDTESTALGPLTLIKYAEDSLTLTEESSRLQGQPAILFFGNTANGGGAVYLEGNGQVNFTNCRFAANKAMIPPTSLNYSGLYGLEKDYSMAKALPCYNGGGGAVCVVGQANRTFLVRSSDMINNVAKDGAGVFIAEGLDCVNQASCYSVTLDLVNMTGNTAASRGGGLFWMHEGVLNISSCPSDKLQSFQTNGTVLLDVQTGSEDPGANMHLRAPVRKGPGGSSWYAQLTIENQESLLSTVGGAVRASSSPVHAVNGEVVVVGLPVFAATGVDTAGATKRTPNGTIAVDGAYLTNTGHLLLPNTSNGEPLPGWIPIGGRPVVFSGAALPDPSWLGVPYNHLPCANWNNTADTGSDISTTPFLVLSPLRLDYYTSNTDIKINVTVHDWLGQPCTGGNDTQPLVLVQAESAEVSGSVTQPAVNGTAVFKTLRLRAREGLHTVTMTGRVHAPVRDLLTSQVQIYVRPCAINEFLSPKNLDECIPCDSGSYNFNMSAVACLPCPDNAECLYPDPAACKLDAGCDVVGYLVPQDGYWHSNFFSEEVIECTNSDACTKPNRSSELSEMQFAIWQAARKIQLDASTRVADKAAQESLAKLLSSMPLSRRRLLQEKALSDEIDVLLILNATGAILPKYMESQCASGYTGTLCGECADGYGWRRIATCSKCPPRVLNNLYYALVTLLTLSLLAFTVYSSLKEQRRPGRLVGGMTGDKAKGGRLAKVNPTGSGGDALGVQASGPSQFHVILAAAAVEDAAAEVAPALALLREHSYNVAMGDVDPGNPYEYVDPVMAAVRHQFASSPGVIKNRPASPLPYPMVETAARAHSVLGVPARASRWSTHLEGPRRETASFSRMDNRGVGGVGSIGGVGFGNGAYGDSAGSQWTAAGGSNVPASKPVGAGPVAEGAVSGYDNALYEGAGAVAGAAGAVGELSAEIQFVDEVAEEAEVEEGYASEEFLALAAAASAAAWTGHEGRRPVAESKDYTNALFEGPRPMEIRPTDSVAAGTPSTTPAAAAAVTTSTPKPPDNGPDGGAADIAEALPRGHQLRPGVVLQSVPLMQNSSPPRTPLHASVTSVPPAALELPTVLERTRLNEIPRRGAVVGRERAHQSTVVKIFLSYIQVLALLQNVPLEIPGVVDVYYRINNQAISYPGILVSLDCSLPNTSVSKAFVRVILTVLAPLYIFAGAVVWFMIFNVIDYYVLAPYYAKHPSKKNRKRHLQLPSFQMHLEVYLGRQLIVTFITIFFFFYPSVVQSLMTIFNCQDVNVQNTINPLAAGLGLHTERIWSQDYSQTCYKGSHLALVLGLGVPGVLLIAIGWPLMSALFMTGKLACMNNISLTEDMTSFFLADFKARFAWWESVIMLRKLFIAVIVTLVDGSTSAGVQLLLVICVLVIASGIHLATMPYHHIYTNNLELMSLGTLLATLYFSLYFGFSTSISNGGRVAISILILIINIVMVLVFVFYIIQAYYYAALCKTGLSDLDSEARRKLTAAELRQRILENLNAQGSTTSFQDGGTQQSQPPAGQQPRSNYRHMASFYTAAVWATMRVGSTTNKVLTKVKTLLREPNFSNPPSREDSTSRRGELDGVPAADGAGSTFANNHNDNSQLNLYDTGATLGVDDDPEAARGSPGGRNRAVSGPGASPSSSSGADTILYPTERPSPTAVKPSTPRQPGMALGQSDSPSMQWTPREGAANDSGIGHGSGSGSQHVGDAGTAAAVVGTGSGTAAVVVLGSGTAATTRTSIGASPPLRAAPQVLEARVSPVASLEGSGLPAASAELADAVAVPEPAPPAPPAPPAEPPLPLAPQPLPPLAVAPPASSSSPSAASRPNVRMQSRLSQASGHADRSGELLPPPPSFPVRGASKP